MVHEVKAVIYKIIYSRKLLFYFLLWMGIFIFLVAGICSNGETVISYLHNDPNDTYMDFFNSIQYGLHPYESNVIYPPLVNMIYYICGKFIPWESYSMGPVAYRESQMGRLLMGIYLIITVLLFVYSICITTQETVGQGIFLSMTLLLSGPYIYMVERGNIIFLVVPLMLFYLNFYRSDKKYLRHIAFISISVAAGLKIYPALFGILLLREKRWRDAIVCLIYGVFFFFMPFAFFGGIKNIPVFISNVIHCSNVMNEQGYGFKVDIGNTIGWIGSLGKYTRFWNFLEREMWFLILVISLVIMIWGKYNEEWKVYAIPALMMILLPGFSYIYSLIFVTIPLLFFLKQKSIKKTDYIYLGVFVLILFPKINCVWNIFKIFETDKYPLQLSTCIEGISVLLLWITLAIEGMRSDVL